ncbi:hypothetical protein EUTSA_v10027767mg [Eutrema salsugineum]|uniref:F-box domain-containing protein n=1 Tax=Eutrema salsugineum TaxID=72664 RepID=V4LXD0_EUTSA|nr:FBD-associated F-box protein At5g38590 [Eutrema salsugineum]XP_024014787.1 FBD-associated F-box protein At5g38590 [Eutrema salsugineum]ESQ47202.1 hypothetical protein EUTSA_v10027767mg [Eutrema salsugineum]
MARLSDLPDELLVKILLYLPTKVAVSTSVLSKQWQFLWMWLPKLEYSNDPESTILRDIVIRKRDYQQSKTLRKFIDKNLPLHRAPVIESLRLDFVFGNVLNVGPETIRRWVQISVSRCLRELEISYISKTINIFPGSFYTCASLVILKLSFVNLMDVPLTGCLRSLKTLELINFTYDQESLQRLLSICPVLEDLSVNLGHANHDTVREFTIIVPSLRSLSFITPNYWPLDGYLIDTPSSEYFKLEDWNDREHYGEIRNMPKLKEAYVDLFSYDLKSIIRSITSAKRLTICSKDDVSGDGFVFKHLEHLKLCGCKEDSSTFLGQLLQVSPNLRVLDICVLKDHNMDGDDDFMGFWNQPSRVPECLLSSLQILNWSRYFGRPQEREIAVYILKNACRLKKATIWADTEYYVSNLEMIKELTLSSRASSTCELVFVEDDTDREPEPEAE